MFSLLKNIRKKSKISFAVIWIVAYCIFMSLGDAFSELVGVKSSFSVLVALILSLLLLLFLNKNSLMKEYGLCKSRVGLGNMLYYVPFLLILSANFWNGVTFNFSGLETVLFILSMLFVGFLEEVIFRGILFDAMRKDGEGLAIAVSSITFGIGHIINLLNGAELLPTLCQLVYASAAGFMFVAVFKKSKSLIACIVTHGVFNAFSAFAVDAKTQEMHIISCVVLTVISLAYGIYLLKAPRLKE